MPIVASNSFFKMPCFLQKKYFHLITWPPDTIFKNSDGALGLDISYIISPPTL
jgi:hypothetical protein